MSWNDPRVDGLQVYLVGGAVRDRLLGRTSGDRDWVVVGSEAADLLTRGFKAVGADFPVFLHPHSGEEYALARTERKSGRGYRGFVVDADPSVTLEQDLLRRDLTINAIAQDADGALIDPHGGIADLQARVLRHVSPAFAEDPVRILRVARFAARFAPLGFALADETLALMRSMVAAGEVDHLVPEKSMRCMALSNACSFIRKSMPVCIPSCAWRKRHAGDRGMRESLLQCCCTILVKHGRHARNGRNMCCTNSAGSRRSRRFANACGCRPSSVTSRCMPAEST